MVMFLPPGSAAQGQRGLQAVVGRAQGAMGGRRVDQDAPRVHDLGEAADHLLVAREHADRVPEAAVPVDAAAHLDTLIHVLGRVRGQDGGQDLVAQGHVDAHAVQLGDQQGRFRRHVDVRHRGDLGGRLSDHLDAHDPLLGVVGDLG